MYTVCACNLKCEKKNHKKNKNLQVFIKILKAKSLSTMFLAMNNIDFENIGLYVFLVA